VLTLARVLHTMLPALPIATCYCGCTCGAPRRSPSKPVAPQRRHYSSLKVSPGIHLFRLAFAVSQRLFPALAVRVACRLFLTPLPLKWQRCRKLWGVEWGIESWPFENTNITVYSQNVKIRGPVALLVHGWGGHAAQLVALAETLASKGLRSVIVEMPGHGRSNGNHSTLPQFARGIEYVAARLLQQGFSIHALAGHALGASAVAFAAGRGLPIERLVLLAPTVTPADCTRLFARVFGLSKNTRTAMQRRIEAREGKLMSQFEPASLGPSIRIATLVVHDKQDNIKWTDGQAYARSIPDAQLITTQGLSHGTLLEDVQVLDQIATFIGN
jgi:pimeloyl-ACP methyl ester carboxylesterase